MTYLETALEWLSLGIELIAAGILVTGAVLFVVNVASSAIRHRAPLQNCLQSARLQLGIYLLAGLEFLIVADILFTIVHRTLDDLIVLAIVTGVRTLVSYFLGRELEVLGAADDTSEKLPAR